MDENRGGWKRWTTGARRDVLVAALVFLAAFFVFRRAPVHQLHDSKYTMLLAENLRAHGDFDLARYGLPHDDYHLRAAGEHRYYYFPGASAVLSVPFVAAMRLKGTTPVTPHGAYDEQGELALDAGLAALLMSFLAATVYATARQLLPVGWSLGVAAWAAFGTQVLSTASRSVWSDTWGIVLVLCAVFLLVRSSARGSAPNAVALALLAGVAYVVRPTNAAAIVGIGAVLAATRPRVLWRYALTLAIVAGGFVAHSLALYGAPLPPYFSGNRLAFPTPFVAVAGNLVSPSRGVLVYVPALLAVAAALVRYRRHVRFPHLVAAGGFVVLAHFVLLAGFWDWWGGHSYGPRLTTSLVPWFVLFAILAADAARTAVARQGLRVADRALFAAAGLLCAASIATNAVGAWSWAADRWNVVPDNINADRGRLWSWRRPQFLSPFVAEPETRLER